MDIGLAIPSAALIRQVMPKRSRKSAHHVTVGDVAALAGVSTGAVSAVLNNRAKERGIGSGAANRVREAARKLGYKPNISARLMRRGSASQALIVALITSYEAPEGVTSHAMSLIHHLQEAKAKDHFTFQVVIEMFSAGRLKELPGLLTGEGFNLAVITNTIPGDDAFLSQNRISYPAIALNRRIPGLPSIVDCPRIGEEAARILSRKRRKDLAVLHGVPETQATLTRKNDFLYYAQKMTGQPAREIKAPGLSQEAGYCAMKNFLKGQKAPQALYCVMDTLAIGACRALRDAGLKIPKDIALLGVGDNSSSLYIEPPLSTVGPNHEYAMKALGEMILQSMADPGSVEPVVVEVPIEIHLRESTGD